MADTKSKRKASVEIVVPSVRTYRLWTPGQLRQAEASADSGNIRGAVDLCDWILGDDKVRGALDGRVGAWMGLPLSFDGSGDRRRSGRAKKDLELGEDWDAIFPAPEAKQINVWSLLLGLGPGLQRWKRLKAHGDRDIPVTEFYHPQSLRYDWYKRTWLRRVSDSGLEEPVTFGDGVWLGHMPFGTFRPWQQGFWRPLSRLVLLKAYAISDYGRLGESVTRNVVEQDLPAGADAVNLAEFKESSKKLRKELASELRSMARDSAIVLPAGFRYRLVEQAAATKDLFKQQIEIADLAIAICLRGGNLSTNVQEGSLAAAEMQERGGELTNRREDAGAWVTTTHDQTLTHWADANYGDEALAPWPQYAVKPEEDRKKKADVIVQAFAGEAAAVARGYKPKRKEFLRAFALDDIFEPGEEPPPPTLPPAGGTGGGLPGADGKGGKGGKADPKDDAEGAKGKQPKARARFGLASGDRLSAAPGFLRGQLYADALTERATEAGIAALEPTIEAILEELDAATDYDDLRKRLTARYAKLEPEELNDLVFAAMALGNLAGRVATNEDA